MAIRIKRVYQSPSPDDGVRILVDRLWPRGFTHEKLQIQSWMKGIAPSTELRKWFNHEEAKQPEFLQRYFKELEGQPLLVNELLTLSRQGTLTLVYSARDEERNQAAALKQYLEALE